MKTFGLGLGLLSILSTDGFAEGYMFDKAARYDCSNKHLLIQVPYAYGYDGGASSLWFKVRVQADGSVDSSNHSAEFAEKHWLEREDKKWESKVEFRGEPGLDATVICRELGKGCTLDFSLADKAASSEWDNVTCKESRYVPKFENFEMEIGGVEEYQGLKFDGILWDFEGFFNLELYSYTIKDTPESWSSIGFSVSDVRRFGSGFGFTMDVYETGGYCTKDEEEEFCASGQHVWPEVSVLVSKNSSGIYEGKYYEVKSGSSVNPVGDIFIRPR